MNRTTPTLIAACLLASAFAVSAQSAPATAPEQADPQLAAQADLGQSDATPAVTDNQAPGDKLAAQTPYNCLQYTGSRIRTADRKTGKPACAQGPGRTYGRDDLERTGQVDLHDALRHLDPSIK